MPMWGQAPLTTFGAGMRLVHAPTTVACASVKSKTDPMFTLKVCLVD